MYRSIAVPPLRALTRHALWVGLGLDMPRLDVEAVGDDDVTSVASTRLATNALAAIRREAPVSPAITASLVAFASAEARTTARVLAAAPDLQQTLAAASIRSLAVKGAAVADLHPAGYARRFGDVDLLVAPSDYRAAFSVLVDAGFVPADHPDWNDRTRARYLASTNFADASRRQVDVHRLVGPWPLGTRLRFDDLWRRRRSISAVGGTITAVGVEDTLVMTCLSMLGDWSADAGKLWPWRDVVVLSEMVDPEQLVDVCGRAQLGWVVEHHLAALPEVLRPAQLVRALAILGCASSDRMRRSALTSPRLRNGAGDHAVRLSLPRATCYLARVARASLLGRLTGSRPSGDAHAESHDTASIEPGRR